MKIYLTTPSTGVDSPQIIMKCSLFIATVLAVSSIAKSEPQAQQLQVSTPYWNQGESDPSNDIRAVPLANAMRVRLRWQYRQSLIDLNNTVHMMQVQFECRPDYVAAITDERQSYGEMLMARANALGGLKNNAAYIASQDLCKYVSAQIAYERSKKKPDDSKLLALASIRMDFISDNRKLEADALGRDQNYQNCRKRMIATAEKLSQMNTDQQFAVATDPTLIGLRKQFANARIERLTADAYFAGTVQAANAAIDYARYYRRFDYGNGYGYGGYAPWRR